MVKWLTKLNTKSITAILEDWFIDMGKPVWLRSDGGPQFRSEFEDRAKKENITHELSSPYRHRSNGRAEVTVRKMKHLLKNQGLQLHPLHPYISDPALLSVALQTLWFKNLGFVNKLAPISSWNSVRFKGRHGVTIFILWHGRILSILLNGFCTCLLNN